MCYQETLDHKGIAVIISNCFGVGFDWKDPAFVNAVKNRDESIFEILDWMANGGAESCDAAYSFAEYLSYSNYSLSYEKMKSYSIDELQRLLNNKYLPSPVRSKVEMFFSGELKIKAQEEKEDRKNKKQKTKKFSGYVYLILAENGLYKIGRAKSVSTRLKPFEVSFPMSWKLVYSFYSDDYIVSESDLHKRFESKRKVGEWFELDEKDVEYIKSIQDDKYE